MDKQLYTIRPKLTRPWIYFLATLAWTWAFWGIAILIDAPMGSVQGLILLLLGVIGPMVTGITFVYLTQDKKGRQDYWKRIRDFKRIPAKWYLIIFLTAPIVNLLGAFVDIVLSGNLDSVGENPLSMLLDPLSIGPSMLFIFLIPFIEELGWRGYALDRLQERYNAIVSSLILGIVWSLWHLPLFFIRGSYQADLGPYTLDFWLFMLGIVFLSFPFTWIYNHTNRSILSAILFHAIINLTGELITLTQQANVYCILLWLIIAISITLSWRVKKRT